MNFLAFLDPLDKALEHLLQHFSRYGLDFLYDSVFQFMNISWTALVNLEFQIPPQEKVTYT